MSLESALMTKIKRVLPAQLPNEGMRISDSYAPADCSPRPSRRAFLLSSHFRGLIVTYLEDVVWCWGWAVCDVGGW